MLRETIQDRAKNSLEHGDRKKYAAFERDLLEADKENERIRAALSTLESQLATLQGALTAMFGAKRIL